MATKPLTGKFVLTSTYSAARSSFRRPDGQHANPTPGQLLQINTIDQFSDWSAPSIAEFNAPNAVCGFCTLGNALILSRLLKMDRSEVVSQSRLADIVAEMRNEQRTLSEMREAMQFTYEKRLKWMNKQPESYWNAKKRKSDCIRVWAANHELSDYMISRVVGGDKSLESIHFLRYNQWPERDHGEWEEAERLIEEKPFGGENKGEKDTVELEAGSSRFIVERFCPTRILQRPEDWLKEENKRCQQFEGRPCPPNIFMLDLNGHFAVGVGLLLETGTSSPPLPTFIMFNTTSGNYLSEGSPTVAFDLSFPPRETEPSKVEKL